MKSSLQFKIGLSYLSIIAAVLIILNTYPLIESQNLVFRSKETTLNSSVKVIGSALSGLNTLTEGNVEKALSGLEETGASRVLVTDTAGRVLYDSRRQENAGSTPFTPRSSKRWRATTPFTAAMTAKLF